MSYSVGEVAKITGLSPHTLRYYDKQGLMPFLQKDENGVRNFRKLDIQWLQVIECMKVSGFSIAEMRHYADLVRRGDETLGERLEFFEERRQRTRDKIKELELSLDALNYKCWYYQQAVEAGTERVHFTREGYDQSLCYSRFKEWEDGHLDNPSEIRNLFRSWQSFDDPASKGAAVDA